MDNLIEKLKSKATLRKVRRKTILLYQGEVPRHAFVLVSGVVMLYSINAAGDEQIVSFHRKGDVFPVPWLFGAATSTLYYCEAVTDCEVLTIPRSELLASLEESKESLKVVNDMMIRNYTSMMMRVTALEQSRARDKIIFTLYFLLFRYGEEIKKGVYAVKLGLTHANIANMIGITRETAAMELGALKKAGIVEYDAREYTIDRTKLERMMGEDSFNAIVQD